MADSTGFGDLNSQDWDGLQDVASRFEKACRDAEKADLAAFLPPPEAPLRPTGLRGLIQTGPEARRRKGSVVGLEYYAEKFPELGGMTGMPASLLYEEYRVRQLHGDRPQLLTYQTRFPNQYAELEELVRKQPVEPPPTPFNAG